ncbi:glycosyltransferase [uncultured Sphaerochaeta sp.]|uniref:glycosyltransferase n=1 Tax=uncultured Sphaerochaeta sp. TaxID=886478 RepID=UPI002A0A9614|nr:glycosyltransferase [uncultured Sphaerochaeta sp.]
MKILLTTDLFLPAVNDIVTSVMNLRQALREKGHEVRILTISPIELSYFDNEVYYIGSMKHPIYQDRYAAFHLPSDSLKDILSWAPEIVHSQCEFYTFNFAKTIAKKADIPLIHTHYLFMGNYSHYTWLPEQTREKALSHTLKNRLSKACKIIAPSQYVHDTLLEIVSAEKIVTIPLGIDLEKFKNGQDPEKTHLLREKLGIEQDCPVLISIGRLMQEKNCEMLIKNMVSIVQWNAKVKLLFIGEGPMREKLEQLGYSLGISENLIFTGMITPSEISLYFQIGTVFVTASTEDTLGITYREALASGLPVICRKDYCLEKDIINGLNGYVFQSETELTNTIKNILFDKELLKSLSTNAVLISKRYALSEFGASMEAVYLECIEQWQKKGIKS